MPESHSQRVANYYDRNTRHFLLLGRSGKSLAIHRELWASGIRTSEAAAAHINDLIAEQVLAILGEPPRRLIDLGCGVGGTLLALAGVWPETDFVGYTLSSTQAQIGGKLIDERKLGQRCQVFVRDFTQASDTPRADVVIAIESHTHLESLSAFIDAATQYLAPGGLLIMVDDMLAHETTPLPAASQTLIERFKRGWRLGHLPTSEEVIAQARTVGLDLIESRDLSPLLRLNRISDHLLVAVAPGLASLGLARYPAFANMIGGSALTLAHRRGLMKYMMLTFRSGRATG